MTRVLVVEDDAAILRGLKDNLEAESYEVLTATDGEVGYQLIRDAAPDLVVLDLMLPKMSGYELCKKVRDEGMTTPILMLTARGEETDRVLGLDLGADDYVTKPFHPRELLARVRSLVRVRGLQKILADRNETLERALSDLKQAEVQLVQSERFAAVGELAAGIAHAKSPGHAVW